MKVSVIIAARDAEPTLAETLRSLQAQEHTDWEALVIDDGSRDGTADLARRFATDDARIRVLEGPAAGVGAARNLGLRNALGEAILFLDADDLILPRHLVVLTAPLEDPTVAAAYGEWARLAPDGTVFDSTLAPHPDTMFEMLARTCIVTVHSLVVRKEHLLAAGGFRTDWRTCEDWDLWQRLARTGARFVQVPERVALYRMSPGSASMDDDDLVRNGLAVVDNGHRPDPRVEDPAPEYAAGCPERELAYARLQCLLWAASIRIGRDIDAIPLLRHVEGERVPRLDPWVPAGALFSAVLLPSASIPSDWWELWPGKEATIRGFLAALEEHSGTPHLARRALTRLESAIVAAARADAEGRRGSTVRRIVDVLRPIEDLDVGDGVRSVVVQARRGPVDIGPVPVAVRDGKLRARDIADRIAREKLFPLLAAHYAEAPGAGPVRAVGELASRLGDLMPHRRKDMEEWATSSAHRLAALREIAPRHTAPAIDATDGRVALEMTDPLPDVRVARPVLVVRTLLGGVPLRDISVPTRGGHVTASALRRGLMDGLGTELLVAAVRDGLIGRPSGRLGDVLRRSAAERRGRLPDPGATDAPVPRIVDAAPASRRALDVAARLAERGIPGFRERRGPRAIADRLPVLMFHRVADEGAEHSATYRAPLAWFDGLLDVLVARGYHTVTLREWSAARERRRQLHGRPILLTFDDAYEDFAENAWPRLRAHGFGAHVFVVTDRAGGSNEWDHDLGEELPLLGWDALRSLHREGVHFGSHTASHAMLTGLETPAVIRELEDSRARLAAELGELPDAIAYPYGDVDPVVSQIAAGCGYTYGLSCEEDVARYHDNPMMLPRFLADPSLPPARLVERMERRWGKRSEGA